MIAFKTQPIVHLLMYFILSTLTFWSCEKNESHQSNIPEALRLGYLDDGIFNESFAEGKIAHTPEYAGVAVLFDSEDNIVSYSSYWQAILADEEQEWHTSYISLPEYLEISEDPYYAEGYIKVLDMPNGKPMFLYDPYADREKRLTRDEETALRKEIERKIGKLTPTLSAEYTGAFEVPETVSERSCSNGGTQVWNVGGERLQTGDMFYQWGENSTWWGGSTPCPSPWDGSSPPGHISVVDDNDSYPGRLDRIWITEAWANFNPTWPFTNVLGSVRKQRAHCTWGDFTNKVCTNYWANKQLQNNNGARSTMSNFLNGAIGSGYGATEKRYWVDKCWTWPNWNYKYYCSLLAWQAYRCALGWSIDHDGGLIVFPNDIHFYAYNHSNVVGGDQFNFGDF